MKQLLASLIARMQKVLAIQNEIYQGTIRLEKVPVVERSHNHEIESGRLSSRERGIVRDVEEALRLLREEGSAIAMPEALTAGPRRHGANRKPARPGQDRSAHSGH